VVFLFGKRWTRRGRHWQSQCKKHAGGMFFSPGKSPIAMRAQPGGCECIAILRIK
jgi:hypothetical protein